MLPHVYASLDFVRRLLQKRKIRSGKWLAENRQSPSSLKSKYIIVERYCKNSNFGLTVKLQAATPDMGERC